ncbi:MAG: hypothetical protein ABIO72_00035 [Patescibacteria group bacterium]
MKKLPLITIVALMVLTGGYFLWSYNFTATQVEFSSTETRLFGRVSQADTSSGKNVVKVELLQNIEGQQNMENAAIADGVCTLDQVQKNECLNNPFYIQRTENTLDLELDPQVNIQVYAREAGGGMLVDKNSAPYLQQMPVTKFMGQYMQASGSNYLHGIPFYFGIKKNKIVRVQEKYVP